MEFWRGTGSARAFPLGWKYPERLAALDDTCGKDASACKNNASGKGLGSEA